MNLFCTSSRGLLTSLEEIKRLLFPVSGTWGERGQKKGDRKGWGGQKGNEKKAKRMEGIGKKYLKKENKERNEGHMQEIERT